MTDSTEVLFCNSDIYKQFCAVFYILLGKRGIGIRLPTYREMDENSEALVSIKDRNATLAVKDGGNYVCVSIRTSSGYFELLRLKDNLEEKLNEFLDTAGF
nr:hypothetical protein K-LCC10_0150 [Kaumoebavirus]